MLKISPSILAADFSRLGDEAGKMEKAGAQMLHIDVMDGHFVPNLTIGVPVIASLRKATSLTFDVHLMIDNPEEMADAFLKAGADVLTFHHETARRPDLLAEHIRSAGALPAAAVKPGTPVEAVFPYLDRLSMVLVMTVEPGFGGQKLIESCLDKAAALRRECDRRGLLTDIEIDGGVTPENVGRAAVCGVNVFVAGSSVFHTADPAAAVRLLKENAARARLSESSG